MGLNFPISLIIHRVGDDDGNTTYLRVYHGGDFDSELFILHAKGGLAEVKTSLDYISVKDINDVVVEFDYAVKRIKTIYFSRRCVLFKEGLVKNQNDVNITELMEMYKRHPHVYLFVKDTNAYDD